MKTYGSYGSPVSYIILRCYGYYEIAVKQHIFKKRFRTVLIHLQFNEKASSLCRIYSLRAVIGIAYPYLKSFLYSGSFIHNK